jgi:acyl-CoA synthetase (AMP-forming)/AMP-acid ligase II
MASVEASTLATIALGGEAVSITDLRALWAQAPSMRVFNRYGPTETTIAVTNAELSQDVIDSGVVTIGSPHAGVTFYIVDDAGVVIEEAGLTGELYIGGIQLMDGYWKNRSLTAEVMRRDVVAGETLYRSGDFAYRDETGNYVYAGRMDRVVKRSGVRISLVELGALLGDIPGVTGVACLTFDHDGELGIVAFVSTLGQHSAVDLRRAAGRVIPQNMLPDRIEVVRDMPLNRSNQLDEARLLYTFGLQPLRSPTTGTTIST